MSGSRSAHPGESPAPKRLNVFERYLTLWVALCMGVGIFAGKMFPAAVDALAEDGVRQGEPDQHPDRGPDLADDLPDDAQGGLHLDPRGAEAPEGADRHARRQLAGEAVFDGADRVSLLQAPVPALDRAGAGGPVPRRDHHPRGRAVHGDGLRLELPDGRGPGVHPGPGLGERPDHARPVRPDREVPDQRRVLADRPVHGARLRGGLLHRHPPGRRGRLQDAG